MTLYPIGYGTELVTLEELERRELGDMLPEAKRRHLALIVDRGGELGIGDGWRPTPSDTSEASRKGQSFHQTQTFADGSEGWVAIDFVCRNIAGGKHVAPATGVIPVQGSSEAKVFGIHANVGTPGQSGFEPWHGQPIELDGWQTWHNAGRPMIQQGYPLPGDSQPDPIPTPTPGDDEMSIVIRADDDPSGAVFWWDGRQIGWVRTGTAVDVGRVCGLYTTEPLNNFTAAEIQAMIDSGWAGGPMPPGFSAPSAVDSGVT